jgi:hypothetical protein
MPCSSESADGNTNNPVAEIFAELRERLQCGGPEVRLELVQALIDGSLSPEDHTTVQGNVDRYREWNDAYWELRTTAKEGDEEI